MDEPFALSLSKGCPFPATVKVSASTSSARADLGQAISNAR
jgi:hypothetical protein